jgi:AP-2 complex subunit alpha
MPPYPERTSALLSRLHQKHSTTSDKRTWVVGGKDANQGEIGLARQNSTAGFKRSQTMPIQGEHKAAATNGTNGNALSSDLAGLDLNVDTNKVASTPNFASAAHLSPDWEIGYNRLLLRPEGVLYEDQQVQVGIRTEYRGSLGCLIFYFSNRSSFPMNSFTTMLDNKSAETLKTDVKGLPDTTVQPGGQTQQTIMFDCKNVFTHAPTIRISWLAGAMQGVTLQLPVLLHKYMEGAELSSEDFFKRWKQIGGAPREAQSIFGLVNKGRTIDLAFVKKVITGFKWGIVEGVDPNGKNIVGATVLHTSEGGKFGCLLRLEPNFDTSVCHALSSPHFAAANMRQMFRITIRATDEAVPPVLVKAMEERLSQGIEGLV